MDEPVDLGDLIIPLTTESRREALALLTAQRGPKADETVALLIREHLGGGPHTLASIVGYLAGTLYAMVHAASALVDVAAGLGGIDPDVVLQGLGIVTENQPLDGNDETA